ncbi:SUMO-specific isopeptidase USPL1 [Phascolarctos cinereus]|uniref:SUMO-specific isopeptidase USPL1 n=1 Tax=Phascolarctos cinereus TaxID=38626 RepID=A0A6P5L4U6_PHACI|nr:SUMO-specific isopeptidase USPL1 [Phascolarctos cinereus]XP_020852787.1 SUMO-specific isopeptidase USPL1 [Phascolarctos cinereus]
MMDSQKIGNGLPVIGQDTGIGISSLHMVGYLGKKCDSAKVTSDGYCPACREKGKIKTLKSYRISFQESISLCEDPQCIYPLGYKSLDNIIVSVDLENYQPPRKQLKRKILESSSVASSLEPNSKEDGSNTWFDSECTVNSELAHRPDGYNLYRTSSDLSVVLQDWQQNPSKAAESLQHSGILEAEIADQTAEEHHLIVGSQTESIPEPEVDATKLEILLENRCLPFTESPCLQWRNAYALCWLDCILSALVHLEGLKKAVTELCPKEESMFQQLYIKYNQAILLLTAHHLNGAKDESSIRNVSDRLRKAETHLNEVRNKIFAKLQPKLHCKLGNMESPVFAFPLLLQMEPLIETLFMSSFSWNFECSQCGNKYQQRCSKNLVTFTNVIPEWHPLDAVHFGPCNSCKSKLQRRRMVLEKVSSVFMLHFVEGLPCNDLQFYSFHFEGFFYQITCVIQYQMNEKHFISWILNSDGTWLECDDLKGPYCKRHQRFEVPASEIHIVIWERNISKIIDQSNIEFPVKKTESFSLSDSKPESLALCSEGDAATEMFSAFNQENILSAPTTDAQYVVATDHEYSLLSGLEDLVDNDIITLTLTEIHVDSEGNPIENQPVIEDQSAIRDKAVAEMDTLQKQELVLASSQSAPCRETPVQPQTLPTSILTQNASIDLKLDQLNTENTSDTICVNNTVHVSTLPQGEKPLQIQETKVNFPPIALEKGAMSNPVLSSKVEKLMSKQSVLSLGSNLKTANNIGDSQSVVLGSTHNSSQSQSQKKKFVGSWVKGLLNKGVSFMPSCASANERKVHLQKTTDLNSLVKRANNFRGFKPKGITNQTSPQAPKKTSRSACNSLPVLNSSPSNISTSLIPDEVREGTKILTKSLHKNVQPLSSGIPPKHNFNGNENHISSGTYESQTHKLRLKLLKKLKAKKQKLATLQALQINGKPPKKSTKPLPQDASPNECESLQGLLMELQDHISATDNKPKGTTHSNISLCNSPTHEEFLAELLSSTTTVASSELPMNRENDCEYLEMVDNHNMTPTPSDFVNGFSSAYPSKDHNYYSPVKQSQYEVQMDSLTNNSCAKTLNLENPLKTDILDEFFSTSVLSSSADDIEYLPHFDEYMFDS